MKLTNIYRYRSSKYLFDELKYQYFYLTPSYDENDINEGRPIFILKGNKYLWIGLFRYYYIFEYRIKYFLKYKKIIPIINIRGDNLFINDNIIKEFIQELSKLKVPLYFYQMALILHLVKIKCNKYIMLNSLYKSKKYSNNKKESLIIALYKSIINEDLHDGPRTFYLFHNAIKQSSKKTIKVSRDILYSIMMKSNKTREYLSYLKRIKTFFIGLSRLVIPNAYIVSFSDRYDNDEMWGNYANGYTGACLEFRVNNGKLHMNDKYKKLFKVNYTNSFLRYNLFCYINPLSIKNKIIFNEAVNHKTKNLFLINDGLKSYINMRNDSVLTKSRDWSKEDEYRLVYFGTHLNSQRKKRYPFKMLKSVILGSRINLNLEMDIIALLQEKCNKYHVNGLKLYKINRTDKGHIDKVLLITFTDRSNYN